MAEKLIFSLEMFVLGFSVVMIVLFALYGLILLFNRIDFSRKGKEGSVYVTVPAVAGGAESRQQLAIAIAAALEHHRKESPSPGNILRLEVERQE